MDVENAKKTDQQPWLRIHDEKISSEALVAEVQQRVEQRRTELGVTRVLFPRFGHMSSYPEPPVESGVYNPDLYHYLKQANRKPTPQLEPLLVPSPSTRVPILGRLWGMVRAQFHQLVLFYVNRSVSDQSQLNINVVSVLNELTRVSQVQQEEIDALRAEVQRLKQEHPRAS
ncbi:MAG: hypothetical protein KC410_07055 [Anaerolineales bacterium]|uniref:hypothetical protein n=1 Tax=Promineifilum sp. TaxID=2664178 RepID=UPI001DA88E91|nr:hypothetical protein [Anaerolineales bacterium]MCO5180042.1 hypothetical protein [Promineifilum sp.]